MKKLLLFISFFTLAAKAQTVALQSFAAGFSNPVEITHAPNDSRLFVVQQGGIIKIVSAAGVVNATPFLTLPNTVVLSGGERGLLGLAFHPNYATNGYFYLNYTRAGDGATVIARYSVSANPDIANTTGTVLLTISQPFSNHNGGTLKFGPDGYLYIGMGDGGSSGDPGNRAQNINENLGKMLRLDVDAASPYIPATNPFVGVAGNDEIWAIGMRNPFKFSFNRLNGDLWIADVGQDVREEINKVSSPLPVGLNFGWRCYEGNGAFDTSSGNCPSYASTYAPLTQYPHTSGSPGRCSITGGYLYTGSTYPNFTNKYFFGDYCTGEIAYINNGAITWALSTNIIYSLTTFGEDKNGELYVALGGTIYKIYDSSLGINNFNKNGLSFYPNPAKTEIFIKNSTETKLSKINVFDLTGKLILTKALDSTDNPSVNISTLSSGIYLIALEDSTGNQYQSKLIVE